MICMADFKYSPPESKSFGNGRNNGVRLPGRIRRRSDRPSNHDVIRTEFNGFLGRQRPFLIISGNGRCPPDPGRDNGEIFSTCLPHGHDILGRTHDASHAGLKSQFSQQHHHFVRSLAKAHRSKISVV